MNSYLHLRHISTNARTLARDFIVEGLADTGNTDRDLACIGVAPFMFTTRQLRHKRINMSFIFSRNCAIFAYDTFMTKPDREQCLIFKKKTNYSL